MTEHAKTLYQISVAASKLWPASSRAIANAAEHIERLEQTNADLLAALRAVDETARDTDRRNPTGDVIIKSEIWDLIQQAIAKAEGKTDE